MPEQFTSKGLWSGPSPASVMKGLGRAVTGLGHESRRPLGVTAVESERIDPAPLDAARIGPPGGLQGDEDRRRSSTTEVVGVEPPSSATEAAIEVVV
ncbi:MAG: hypothetical protein WA726_12065 [Acidimicrobiia bacterium]